MEISIKSVTLFFAVVLTGLSAGLFYAWMVSVIPGTRKLIDRPYLKSMQSINREILNPAFFLIFFGSPVMLGISTIQHWGVGQVYWLLLAATVVYLLGTLGVTILGNVPLNNALDSLDLASLQEDNLQEFRKMYEGKWNRFHFIRTVFSVVSFTLSLMGVFTQFKSVLPI
ncbi:MAG: anthrone oxygenase family protein [Bacteroidota bacterium]